MNYIISSDQVEVPGPPSQPSPSAAQVREEQRRLKEESQRERQRFHATKISVEEAWKRLVRNYGGPALDRDLRHAALNLLEDTQLARLGEEKQAAGRVRAEAGRHEAEERYLALFNSMEQGFYTIEVAFDENQQPTDYRFLEVSPSFERQTGIANASGRWMREIAPDQDKFWFDTYGRVARTGEEARFENYSTPLDWWWSVYAFRTKDPTLRRIAVFFTTSLTANGPRRRGARARSGCRRWPMPCRNSSGRTAAMAAPITSTAAGMNTPS